MYAKKASQADRIAFIKAYMLEHGSDVNVACKAWDIDQAVTEKLRLEKALERETDKNIRNAIFNYDVHNGAKVAVPISILSAMRAISMARSEAHKVWCAEYKKVPAKDDEGGRAKYYAWLDSYGRYSEDKGVSILASNCAKVWKKFAFENCFAEKATIDKLASIVR